MYFPQPGETYFLFTFPTEYSKPGLELIKLMLLQLIAIINGNYLIFGTGSGIYSGGVARSYYINGNMLPVSSGYILISDLPKNPDDLKDFSQNNYTIEALNNLVVKGTTYLKDHWVKVDVDVHSCVRSISAHFNYSDGKYSLNMTCNLEYEVLAHEEEETYALGAYIGASPSTPDMYYSFCSFTKCASNMLNDCGNEVEGFTASTVFKMIKMVGTFANPRNVMTVAFGNHLKLYTKSELITSGTSVYIANSSRPLLAVSMYSRVYPN